MAKQQPLATLPKNQALLLAGPRHAGTRLAPSWRFAAATTVYLDRLRSVTQSHPGQVGLLGDQQAVGESVLTGDTAPRELGGHGAERNDAPVISHHVATITASVTANNRFTPKGNTSRLLPLAHTHTKKELHAKGFVQFSLIYHGCRNIRYRANSPQASKAQESGP